LRKATVVAWTAAMAKRIIVEEPDHSEAMLDTEWLARIQREHGRPYRDEVERRWREALRARRN